MKKMIVRISLSILLWLFFTCGNKNEAVKIEQIAGITNIHNPATPLHPNKAVSFVEELTVGGDDEAGESLLSQPKGFVVDDDENIYASDWSDQDIKVFDNNGNFIRTIGSKGSGPGEFQIIGSIALLPDRRLMVMDFDARRTSIFEHDGQFLNSYQ